MRLYDKNRTCDAFAIKEKPYHLLSLCSYTNYTSYFPKLRALVSSFKLRGGHSRNSTIDHGEKKTTYELIGILKKSFVFHWGKNMTYIVKKITCSTSLKFLLCLPFHFSFQAFQTQCKLFFHYSLVLSICTGNCHGNGTRLSFVA